MSLSVGGYLDSKFTIHFPISNVTTLSSYLQLFLYTIEQAATVYRLSES